MAKSQAKPLAVITQAQSVPRPVSLSYDSSRNRVLVLCEDNSIWQRKWVEHPNSTKEHGWEWEKLATFGVNE